MVLSIIEPARTKLPSIRLSRLCQHWLPYDLVSILDQHTSRRSPQINTHTHAHQLCLLSIIGIYLSVYKDVLPPIWHPLGIFVSVNVCDAPIWPKYATRRALWAATYHDGVTANILRVPNPTRCKCPHNPVNPPLDVWRSREIESGMSRKSRERARGEYDIVPPPPRWDLIEETSARYKVKLHSSLWH